MQFQDERPKNHSPSAVRESAVSSRAALRVEQKEWIAEGVCWLRLADSRGARLPDWAPGAHIDVGLADGQVRQYSLCGDRWDPMAYEIAVNLESDSRGGSVYIHRHLNVGDQVEVGGPRNNFMLAPAEHYLFVAGGIGITPLLPMIEQATMMGIPWRLLYGSRQRARMAFLDRLRTHSGRVTVASRDSGTRLDLAAAVHAAPSGTKVYCCGPASMLEEIERLCTDLPPGSLRRERFVAREQIAPVRSQPYELELARSGRTLTIGPGESILDAVHAAGVPLLASCRQGLCGTCETAVLCGVPDHRDSILSDPERQRNDLFFPCVSRSSSDRLVIDL